TIGGSMFKIKSVFTVLFGLLFFGYVHAADNLKCRASIVNSDHKLFESVDLKVTTFDKNYMRAELHEFSVGADTFALGNGIIALIIYDNQNNSASTSRAGWATFT